MRKLSLRLLLVCALALLLGANVTVGVDPVAPPNDDCSNAEPVGDVANLSFDTTEATFDGPGHYVFNENIWYCYTAPYTGCATVSLLGSDFDTMLAVYDGNDCYPALEDLIEYSDDYYSRQSHLTFPVVAGSKYLIEIGGYYWIGQGVLSISCDANPCRPPNDDCVVATPVGDVTGLSFNTRWATFDGPGHCMTSPNIWYSYTAPSADEVTISLCDSIYDTMLAVYDGNACYPAVEDLIDCNDDFCFQQSQIKFVATAGNKYLIEVGGYGSESGQGLMSISCGEGPHPPLNNDCNNAEPVGNVANLLFNTTLATFDGPGHCMTSPNIWYSYTATCTGNATVSLCGSGYDTMLAVYDGNDCDPTLDDMIECNDDFCAWQSQITFPVVVGETYLIEVGGYGSGCGQGMLSIGCEGEVTENPDLGDAPDSTNNSGAIMHAYPSQGLLPVLVPANYPTVFDDGKDTGPYGPIHLNPEPVAYLGKIITRETEADTGPDQDGLNNIDPPADTPNHDKGDDGVIFPLNMPSCRWATFDYSVNIVNPGNDLWVNVWCDWNRDGDWDDTVSCPGTPVPEWAVQNQYLFNLQGGKHQITTPAFLSWHPEEGQKNIWMRITLSEQPWTGGSDPDVLGNGGSGPAEGYMIGETEDYYFTPDTTCTICEDLNGDGVVDIQDLIAFVTEWLEKCP
jgi:hypothetical protein